MQKKTHKRATAVPKVEEPVTALQALGALSELAVEIPRLQAQLDPALRRLKSLIEEQARMRAVVLGVMLERGVNMLHSATHQVQVTKVNGAARHRKLPSEDEVLKYLGSELRVSDPRRATESIKKIILPPKVPVAKYVFSVSVR